MKKLLFVLCATLAINFANAQPPQGKANVGDQYGAGATADGAFPIAELPAKLHDSTAIETKVKAKVLDVCTKMGCWLKLQVNDSTTAFVKMKDYAFFLPVDIKGKSIVLDGEAKMNTTSVAELRHYAKDAKQTKARIEVITQPKSEIRLMAKGIVVVD